MICAREAVVESSRHEAIDDGKRLHSGWGIRKEREREK